MNNKLRVVLAACILATATTAFGGVKAEQFSVTPVIGGYSFDSGQHLKTSPLFGLRAGYNFSENFGVEALFDFVGTEKTKVDDVVNMYRYGAEMLYHFMPETNFVPYLAAGFSGITLNGPGIGSKARGAFDYGIGAKYFVNDSFALRGDIRHIITRYDSSTHNNVEYTLGAHFPFGAVAPAVKPVEPPAAKPIEPPAAKPVEPPAAKPVEPPAAKPAEPAAEGVQRFCNKPAVINITFDTDKSDIKPDFLKDLNKLGEFLKEFPRSKGEIAGHTDNVGSKGYNDKLSLRRANSVKNYLGKSFSVAPERIKTKGFGYSKPVASNDTEEGRAQNRRIETNFSCE
ncbi:MAG: outer membrane beta-barrel domain-containing protein [Desulfuromonadales bacterium]